VDALLAAEPSARPSAPEVHRLLTALAGKAPTSPSPAAAPTVKIRGSEAAATEIRPAGRTELLPPSGSPSPAQARRRPAVPLMAAAVLIAVLALMMQLRASNAGSATTGPTAATTTAPPGSTPAGAPVPAADDPTQAAHDLADWLRSQAK